MSGTGSIGAGGPSAPDVRALLLQLSLSNARALTSGLQQGDILTAQVKQSFIDGSVMLEVGGKSLIASSAVPLPLAAQVRLQVQIAGNQPVLKLLDDGLVDSIRTSTAASRAVVLGLPATPTAALVQQAFESVAAPLQAERLQAALMAVKHLPVAEANLRAQAFGLLAKINAPMTSPLVTLAERSLIGANQASVPNVAAALQHVQQTIQELKSESRLSLNSISASTLAPQPLANAAQGRQIVGAPAHSATNQATPVLNPSASTVAVAGLNPTTGTKTPVTFQSAVTLPAQSILSDSRLPLNKVSAPTLPPPLLANVSPEQQSIGKPTNLVVNQADRVLNPSSGAVAGTAQNSVVGTTPFVASQPATTISAQYRPLTTVLPSATTPSDTDKNKRQSLTITGLLPNRASLPVTTSATSPAGQPLVTVATTVALTNQIGISAPTASISQSVGQSQIIDSKITNLSQQLAAIMAQSVPPDGGRDGARAVMQALALVGIRPRDTTALSGEPREPLPIQALAQTLTALSVTNADPRGTPLPPAVDQAVTVLVRETLAETIFKPQALADYDMVIAVPMHVHHQPTPTRFAIAERATAAGTATFVRVDTELTQLGPLSVRMSGIEGGALSITLFAHGSVLSHLQAALPALSDSLRELGITAGLRVADWNDSNE
jgi:hypothetical protein